MNIFLWTQILCLITTVGGTVYIYIDRKSVGYKIVSSLYLLILLGTIYIVVRNYPIYWVGYHLTMKAENNSSPEQDIEPDDIWMISKRYVTLLRNIILSLIIKEYP